MSMGAPVPFGRRRGKVEVEGDEGARIRSLQILAPAALGTPVA